MDTTAGGHHFISVQSRDVIHMRITLIHGSRGISVSCEAAARIRYEAPGSASEHLMRAGLYDLQLQG